MRALPAAAVALALLCLAAPSVSAAPKSKRCIAQLTTPAKIDLSRTHWRAALWMDVVKRSQIGPAMLRRPGRRGFAPAVRPGIRKVNVTLPRGAGPGRWRLVLRFTCGKQRQVVRRTLRLVA